MEIVTWSDAYNGIVLVVPNIAGNPGVEIKVPCADITDAEVAPGICFSPELIALWTKVLLIFIP